MGNSIQDDLFGDDTQSSESDPSTTNPSMQRRLAPVALGGAALLVLLGVGAVAFTGLSGSSGDEPANFTTESPSESPLPTPSSTPSATPSATPTPSPLITPLVPPSSPAEQYYVPAPPPVVPAPPVAPAPPAAPVPPARATNPGPAFPTAVPKPTSSPAPSLPRTPRPPQPSVPSQPVAPPQPPAPTRSAAPKVDSGSAKKGTVPGPITTSETARTSPGQ